mgnify:CR=1 FL=1
MTDASLLLQLSRLVLIWTAMATFAFLFHMLVGVLTAGRAEVRRQSTDFYNAVGLSGIVLHIISAGLIYNEAGVSHDS